MANWGSLPDELLQHICEHLATSTDLLRFRSVCPTWRSAARSPPSSASRFPILTNSGISDTSWGFHLSKRTIYSIQSESDNEAPWIVKLERDHSNRCHLLNPLTRSPLKPFPAHFPMPFSFFNFRVKELGQEYALQYIDFKPRANSIGEAGNLYMEKVAVVLDLNNANFALLTIHLSGKLVVYKSGEEKWRVIHDLPSPYDDVILREGKLYAVDNSGRIVLVNYVDLTVKIVANSVYGGDKKFLVDSNGELLLLDMYLSSGPETDMDFDEWFEFYDSCMNERTIKFKVFRLDENAGFWIEVTDLGDRMLFVGENSTFSVNASDVRCKGNCILFTNHSSNGRQEDDVWKTKGAGVFDLESGSIEPIASLREYSKMFWPPPDWVYSIPLN